MTQRMIQVENTFLHMNYLKDAKSFMIISHVKCYGHLFSQ